MGIAYYLLLAVAVVWGRYSAGEATANRPSIRILRARASQLRRRSKVAVQVPGVNESRTENARTSA